MPLPKLLLLLPILFLAACAEGGAESATGDQTTTTAPAAYADQTDNATEERKPEQVEKKMIRTADFHCKVADVVHAVAVLEQRVLAVGGVIMESRVENQTGEMRRIAYKQDSLREIQTYQTTAVMTLRVPSMLLDSVVNSLPAGSTFIESRTLAQQDVTFRFHANMLKNKPDSDGTEAKALALARKTNDVIAAQREHDVRSDQFINRYVENLKLQQEVDYATLTVSFSQPERVLVQTIADAGRMAEVPFGTRASIAFGEGMSLVGDVAVGLLTVWPLLFVVSLGLSLGCFLTRAKRKVQHAG